MLSGSRKERNKEKRGFFKDSYYIASINPQRLLQAELGFEEDVNAKFGAALTDNNFLTNTSTHKAGVTQDVYFALVKLLGQLIKHPQGNNAVVEGPLDAIGNDIDRDTLNNATNVNNVNAVGTNARTAILGKFGGFKIKETLAEIIIESVDELKKYAIKEVGIDIPQMVLDSKKKFR